MCQLHPCTFSLRLFCLCSLFRKIQCFCIQTIKGICFHTFFDTPSHSMYVDLFFYDRRLPLLWHWAFLCLASYLFRGSIALSISSWSGIKGWWRTHCGQKPTRPASWRGKQAVYIIDYYKDKQAYLSTMMCVYILFDSKRSPGNGGLLRMGALCYF